MESGARKSNTLENSIAVVRMSGSFSGGFDQNADLSRSRTRSMKLPETIHHDQEISTAHLSATVNQAGKNHQVNTVANILKRTSDAAKSSLVTGNYMARINPFNKDQHSDEDEDDLSKSNGSEFTSTTSESGDVSLAELGLTEDYFAHPEGLFGMSSVEELEAAIENCKKMILDLPEDSERRKKYVKKLVELRMKFQELKEGPEEIEPKIKQVLGHKLRKRNSSSMKYYCDCCNSLIWGMLQVWYRCKDCGFNCHSKCVNMIRRECVAVGINNMVYSLNISPETGLSAQKFHCAECKNFICISGIGKEEARLCDYTGQYFCPQCHWNDLLVIPARVLHNWDFTPQKVSRRSFQLLMRMSRRPLLNVQEINPMLFNYVEELDDIRKLREDILLMKVYFTTCTKALEMKLLLKLKDQQHFVDGSHMYSMSDLTQAQDGSLTVHLTEIHASFAKHIKLDCLYCQAKGFICEICNSGETLFPFDFGVATCMKCKAVFHRDCFTCIDTLCPRCERNQKKKMQKEAPETASESDAETDYMNDETANQNHPKSDSNQNSESDKDDSRVKSFVTSSSANPNGIKTPMYPESRLKAGDKTSRNVFSKSQGKKKHELSSLHMLLTDSSYTDYALLGFAGAGKGRKSSLQSNSLAKPNAGNRKERDSDKSKNYGKNSNGGPLSSFIEVDSETRNTPADLQLSKDKVDKNVETRKTSTRQTFNSYQPKPTKEIAYLEELNPFSSSKTEEFSMNSDSGCDINPFLSEEDYNPCPEANRNLRPESNINPFEDDYYDEDKNPFS